MKDVWKKGAIDELELIVTGDSLSLHGYAASAMSAEPNDPESYSCVADDSDVAIIERLEEDSGGGIAKISHQTGLPADSVQDHLKNCVEGRRLVTLRPPYEEPRHTATRETWILKASLPDEASMHSFLTGLRREPSAQTAAKYLGSNALLVHFYMASDESHDKCTQIEHELHDQGGEGTWLKADISSYGKTYGAWTLRSELFKKGVWSHPGQGTLQENPDRILMNASRSSPSIR